mmetsp:Transcript_34195/g.107831  ORF Transcript_34195/g.107831 Transcript_34195/m.107831 type:complete len:313 (+) Transcript_34195:696-1634(+)
MAAGAVEDTLGVHLEGHLVGFNGDGHGALGEGVHERGLALFHVDPGVDGGARHGRALGGLALLLDGDVRVVIEGAEAAVGLGELEGIVHEAAVAALVHGVAVHEVLLREVHELAGLDGVGALDGGGGGEAPARAALALVLDLGHGAVLHPVQLLRQADHAEEGGGLDAGALRLHAVEEHALFLLELRPRQVREGVVRHGVGRVLRVVLLDVVVVLRELREAELVDLFLDLHLEDLHPGLELAHIVVAVVHEAVGRGAGHKKGGGGGEAEHGARFWGCGEKKRRTAQKPRAKTRDETREGARVHVDAIVKERS